jgi:hypothetical protein
MGTWRSHTYEVTTLDVAPNRNWFAVADLVAAVEQPTGGGAEQWRGGGQSGPSC